MDKDRRIFLTQAGILFFGAASPLLRRAASAQDFSAQGLEDLTQDQRREVLTHCYDQAADIGNLLNAVIREIDAIRGRYVDFCQEYCPGVITTGSTSDRHVSHDAPASDHPQEFVYSTEVGAAEPPEPEDFDYFRHIRESSIPSMERGVLPLLQFYDASAPAYPAEVRTTLQEDISDNHTFLRRVRECEHLLYHTPAVAETLLQLRDEERTRLDGAVLEVVRGNLVYAGTDTQFVLRSNSGIVGQALETARQTAQNIAEVSNYTNDINARHDEVLRILQEME